MKHLNSKFAALIAGLTLLTCQPVLAEMAVIGDDNLKEISAGNFLNFEKIVNPFGNQNIVSYRMELNMKAELILKADAIRAGKYYRENLEVRHDDGGFLNLALSPFPHKAVWGSNIPDIGVVNDHYQWYALPDIPLVPYAWGHMPGYGVPTIPFLVQDIAVGPFIEGVEHNHDAVNERHDDWDVNIEDLEMGKNGEPFEIDNIILRVDFNNSSGSNKLERVVVGTTNAKGQLDGNLKRITGLGIPNMLDIPAILFPFLTGLGFDLDLGLFDALFKQMVTPITLKRDDLFTLVKAVWLLDAIPLYFKGENGDEGAWLAFTCQDQNSTVKDHVGVEAILGYDEKKTYNFSYR